MKKRFLSVILILAAVLSMAVMPVTAKAETTLSEAAAIYADVLEGYADKTIKESLGHSYSFALAYIDEDDIPEMIVNYDTSNIGKAIVYSINNGNLASNEIYAPFGCLIFASQKIL